MGRYLDLIRQQHEAAGSSAKGAGGTDATPGATLVVLSQGPWSYTNPLKNIEKETSVVSVVHPDISAQKPLTAGNGSGIPRATIPAGAMIATDRAEGPHAWVDSLRQLHGDLPPHDVPPKRWQQFTEDCRTFLAEVWTEKAARLGWGELDLFGCDRDRPYNRVDHLGLVWFINGGRIVDLDRHKAVIEMRTGARGTFRRRPFPVEEVGPVWEIVR